jgi:exopolyphosphatase/guanosine-5'-triphosphate,3'-diphosphate pyrophosphatase
MFRILVLVTLLSPAFSAAEPAACERKARAVIDLGSGSVKLNVAEVDVCPDRNKLVKMLDDGTSKPLALEAGKDSAGNIPPALQNQMLTVLRELRELAVKTAKAAKYKSVDLTIVGTHAFRTAQNQAEVQAKMEADGFAVKALSQKEEAESGLYAVLGQGLPPGCDPNSLLVWDIGGGSMQLIRGPNPAQPTPRVEGFNMGAESFKQALLTKFKPAKTACVHDGPTPNPIGKAQAEDVRTFARDTTQRLLRATLKRDLKATCVVGIGGVHSKAISAQLEKSWPHVKDCVCKDSVKACTLSKDAYHKVQLECLARHLSEKSDCDAEIQGPYSTTAVTNLYFVLGWMDRLGIERIQTRAINMGHHLVLSRDLVKFNTIAVPGAK